MSPFVKEKVKDIQELCIHYHVVTLDIFGSAATGSLKPNDLDFLVEFQSLPPGEHAKAYFNLLEDLKQLFGCHIDLVEDVAITNPFFRQSVDETRKPIYAA